MGSGVSSKGTRATVHAVVGTVRLKKNTPSRKSSASDLAPSEGQTTQAGGSNDMEVEGRQLKSNKKSVSQTSTTTTKESSKKGKEKAKPSESKNSSPKPVKPEKSGDKGKPAVNKVTKTSESKKPASKTVPPKKATNGNDRQNVAPKSVQLSTGSDLGQRVERVLRGFIEENCPLNSRTVRIFLSSTFTDTEHERNALMEHVYPKLRQFCEKRGYEFQVVDMRWGVRDDATDAHMTTELCLREIKACQEISVGPNFVTLLSEKYGYRPLMPSITAQEFELILSKGSENKIHELLTKWYKMDENCFPVSYILQPVTTWIPNFLNDSCDLSQKEEAQKKWESEYNMMKEFLQQAAKEVLNDEDIWQKYVISVSEVEIRQGLLQVENPKRSCVWFHRAINGLDSDSDNPEALKYTDHCPGGICLNDGAHPQALLHNLKNEKMKQAVDAENTFTYDVTWKPNGIDPSIDEHKKYLDQFCKDFENKIKEMISAGISEHKEAEKDNLLYSEVVQHTLFCKRKLQVVYGRKSTVGEIEDYVRSPSRYPLVIHGKSGCGKTSVIAMAAKSISELLDQKGCICLRFLGTTPKSSTILRVLKSIMQQIKHVYGLTTKIPRSSKGVFDQFPNFLSSATKDNPLIIILDSLDQLSPLHGAWKLIWFPRQLPLHVKFIVSTLPDQEYKCFPILKALFKHPKCFVSVPELSSDDVSDILTNWLKSENRTLQDRQLQVLKDAFKKCPLPLFLKISYDETRLWRSYSTISETCLETTIRKAIDKLLERVEISHGEVLVRRALGYITAASLGLTTNELEDILSCDEDLLHDVFQYWTPPIRRLPPLLWVRIRADLSSYLVDRGADGTQVTCWYHRQFIQAAEDRYLSDAVEKKRLHTHIADYFLGRNYVEEDTKETTLIHGKQVRLASISGQPLLLSKGRYNLRKLHELPVQLIRSQMLDELKSEVLCNFEWLSTKVEVRTLRSVLDNFHSAMNAFNDPDIAAVAETLQLAQDAILSDLNQLPAQFVGRLYECKVQDPFHVVPTNLSPVLAKLVQDSRNPPEPALIPSRGFLTPPGGQLVHTLVVNSASVLYGLAATSNGKYVVTGSQEGVVKVWDNNDGSLFLTVPEAGDEIGMITCGCDDDVIIVSSKTGISLISFETGEILQRVEVKFFEGCPPFTLAGEKGSKVVFLKEKGLHVISASSGKFLHQFSGICPVGGAGQNSLLTSWNDTVICNSKEDENSLKVIDTSDYKILHAIKVFSEKDEEEFLHLTQVAMKSDNEVLVAKKMKIDLYSVDSGEHLRTYKCKIDDWIRNLSLDPAQNMLVFPKENKVALLDLESGERKDVLPHPNFVSRVFAVGYDVILTSGGDNVVRVWDLTREDVHQQVEKPETVLNIYSIPGDSRHLVTLGRLGIDNFCVTIWDLATMLPLRKITGITTSYLQIINDRRAAIRVKENVAIVDLHTWRVVNVLKGKIPPYDFLGVDDVCVVNDSTEILTYSHDRKHLTLYDIETGDQVAMLKSGHDIRSFLVNSEGTVVVWDAPKPADQLHVWDLETREQIFVIKREGCERLTLTHAGFTPDGDYFVSSAKKGKKESYIRVSAVWDIRKKELLHDLRYPNDTDTISLTILDNTRVITAHKDLNIVCWDIEEGTPIHILPSNHFSNLRINIMASKGDIVVSYDKKTLIMWDMRAGAQKATFTADKVTAIHPVGEGQCIALGYESVLPLVLLTLQGGDVKPYEFPTEGTKAIAGTGMLLHDLRYPNDTDTISLTILDNTRVITAHKDLNIVCWDIEEDMWIEFEGVKGDIVADEDEKISEDENEAIEH